MQAVKCKMQNAKCKMQNAKCKLLNAKCRMQNAKCKLREISVAPLGKSFHLIIMFMLDILLYCSKLKYCNNK